MILDKCTGPACPRCGCQDADIKSMPAESPAGQYVGGANPAAWSSGPWLSAGRARCRHCNTPFTFRELPEPEPTPEPEAYETLSDPTICPECGGKRPAYKTKGRTQHRKCKDCGKTSKTTRRA